MPKYIKYTANMVRFQVIGTAGEKCTAGERKHRGENVCLAGTKNRGGCWTGRRVMDGKEGYGTNWKKQVYILGNQVFKKIAVRGGGLGLTSGGGVLGGKERSYFGGTDRNKCSIGRADRSMRRY